MLGALELGYRVYVVEDAVRAVNVNKGDGQRAIDEIKAKGAQIIS